MKTSFTDTFLFALTFLAAIGAPLAAAAWLIPIIGLGALPVEGVVLCLGIAAFCKVGDAIS